VREGGRGREEESTSVSLAVTKPITSESSLLSDPIWNNRYHCNTQQLSTICDPPIHPRIPCRMR
jgi:hypothetical protein